MVLFAAVAILCAAETGQSLFQKALTKERAEADPAGAILLYEQVVKEFRATASWLRRHSSALASATWRSAMQRPGGHLSAWCANSRIRRRLPSRARQTQHAIDQVAEQGTEVHKNPSAHKVSLEGEMALSPDGQQLAYFYGGALWLLPVHGASDPEIAGAPRRITEPNPAWLPGERHRLVPRWEVACPLYFGAPISWA